MFSLPPLPYAYDALEPTVSKTTFEFHHDKHHKAYVDKANAGVGDAGLEGKSMEEVVAASTGGLFNAAAQAWNHAFFWECMTPDYSEPSADFAALKDDFLKEGAGHFASGWVWIVYDGGALKVISTHDADTALKHGVTPILVCDLWEHAYYLDYQNDRPGFLKAWWEKVANFDFAETQLKAAKGEGEGYKYPA